MARENPTFLDECWSAPIQGAVYAAAIELARAEGHIGPIPVDTSNLVNTSWDLGSPAKTAVWFWQIVGREIRILACDRGTLTERVAGILSRGFNLGKHYLPHDAQQTERTGTTFATELVRAGLPGNSVVIVPRTADVWIGINHALELFPALSFRSPQCDDGLDALGCYRTRRQSEGSASTDQPIKDWASDTADAFRTMAEAHRAGMVAFRHTHAEIRSDWNHRLEKRKRMVAKTIRVSGGAY